MTIKSCIFLVVILTLLSVVITIQVDPETIDISDVKDIAEINKGAMVDDILELEVAFSAIINGKLWTSPVSYDLTEGLEINAKGVIVKAMDQFRLKTCIDFKPRDEETYYISFQKLNGCFSYIGQALANGQTLSIGRYCDEISTVEHEILHALGFYHEQSRYDRDNYVTIVEENVIEGFIHNFRKVESTQSTTNGVEYDYSSVMHYGQNAFSNGNGTTINTIDPAYQEVIGQRLEMSPRDVQEVNLLYSCNSTVTFQMSCNFDNLDSCGMERCSRSELDWKRVNSVPDGPTSDHTMQPSGSSYGNDTGSFMHVSTTLGNEGDSAWMETPKMSPKGKCHVQCLQFYYYHSGNEGDQLNIWIREFDDEMDTKGITRLMGHITGPATSQWRFHHVSLNATKHFQVEFEVLKGTGNSTGGGFSIDDINLSDSECPHVTIQVDDLMARLADEYWGTAIYSPRQYTPDGYAYRVAIKLYLTYLGLYLQLVSGEHDDTLEWPCPYRQATLKMLDQNPNILLQMNKQRSFTTDPKAVNNKGLYIWDNPRKNGTKYIDENNEEAFAGSLIGNHVFMTNEDLYFREFLKGGAGIFAFSFEDINPLFENNELACPNVGPVMASHPHNGQDDGPCSTRMRTTTTHPPPTTTHKKNHTSSPPIQTTNDKSIFGLSPVMVASPALIFLLTLMILLH
ncbi:meprin A subunit beta-like isoform X2 [Gouania willdenowi]|uniref:meprin A subunit beta-like isoform X2 n=1 Tax=Gouania willdenowi TaxID=441366 RepID=UPI0010548B28|nr:meprin A subunit beta-like isoform X2 [Gouania willdenowi]